MQLFQKQRKGIRRTRQLYVLHTFAFIGGHGVTLPSLHTNLNTLMYLPEMAPCTTGTPFIYPHTCL